MNKMAVSRSTVVAMRDKLTPAQERVRRLKDLKSLADRLMTQVLHPSMKRQITLALHDVREGLVYLAEPEIDRRPSILRIVDLTITLAAARLDMVGDALEDYGPNLTFADVK
jgi:hypothetical protein